MLRWQKSCCHPKFKYGRKYPWGPPFKSTFTFNAVLRGRLFDMIFFLPFSWSLFKSSSPLDHCRIAEQIMLHAKKKLIGAISHQTLRPLFFSFLMQYSIVNLLDFSPWSFLTCSFFISILLGTRTGAPHHWLFPRRPPLPFSSCATLEAAWRMYASSTFFVLRYVALHRFSSLVQPLKYINLIKKRNEGGHGASVWYLPLHMP